MHKLKNKYRSKYRSSWNGTFYTYKLTTNANSTGSSGKPCPAVIKKRRDFNQRNLYKFQSELEDFDNELDFIRFILNTNIDESDEDNNTGQEEGRE